jgi:hypothetical protein
LFVEPEVMPMRVRSLFVAALVASGCRADRAPVVAVVGQPFPAVTGNALDGTSWSLPSALAGKPALLLVAFEMEGQFDVDRWLLGLVQAQTPVKVLEVPTIDGMVPGLFSGTIDSGMRKGIPEEDWGGVVTLFGSDAKTVYRFTGEHSDRNARVLLLDADGRVDWYHERGYSARLLADLDRRARELAAGTGIGH